MSEQYNTPIPSDLLMSDDASIDGVEMAFVDGMPAPATLASSMHEIDFHRAVSLFTTMVPVASLEAIRAGVASQFSAGNQIGRAHV